MEQKGVFVYAHENVGSSNSLSIHRKQERKYLCLWKYTGGYLHVWDKTSSLRITVHTASAGNVCVKKDCIHLFLPP